MMKKLGEEKGMMEIGAILIAIMLIGIGVAVFNSAKITKTDMAPSTRVMEMQSFNSQFTPYAGAGISASQVRSLVSVVISSNATNDNHIISIRTSGDDLIQILYLQAEHLQQVN